MLFYPQSVGHEAPSHHLDCQFINREKSISCLKKQNHLFQHMTELYETFSRKFPAEEK